MPDLSTGDRSALVSIVTGYPGALLRKAAEIELGRLKAEAGELLTSDQSQDARHNDIDQLHAKAQHVEWFLEWIGKFELSNDDREDQA